MRIRGIVLNLPGSKQGHFAESSRVRYLESTKNRKGSPTITHTHTYQLGFFSENRGEQRLYAITKQGGGNDFSCARRRYRPKISANQRHDRERETRRHTVATCSRANEREQSVIVDSSFTFAPISGSVTSDARSFLKRPIGRLIR